MLYVYKITMFTDFPFLNGFYDVFEVFLRTIFVRVENASIFGLSNIDCQHQFSIVIQCYYNLQRFPGRNGKTDTRKYF
jgi:hypothetical protein